MNLDIEQHAVDGWTVLSVTGEIDLATAPEMDAALAAADGDVILDLSAVSFMDSTGIRSLVAAHRAAESADRGFRIVVGRQIERLLEMTGLDGTLPLAGSLDNATSD